MTILAPFFENSSGRYSIRELARVLSINHTSVRQHLNVLVDEGFLSLKREGVYSFYRLVLSKKTLNFKLYYNLEKIRISGIVEDLEKDYDFPVVVLFGSYASASDDVSSDIDLCLITNVGKDFSTKKYERKLGREVSIHKFSRASFEKSKKLNPNLINSICNGIVLSGEFEVLR